MMNVNSEMIIDSKLEDKLDCCVDTEVYHVKGSLSDKEMLEEEQHACSTCSTCGDGGCD